MKRLFSLVLLCFLADVAGARAQGLDDQYIRIFNLIQDADSLSSAHPGDAVLKFQEAQVALQNLQRGSPDWNSKVISFRLSYVADRITSLSRRVPQPVPSAKDNISPPAAKPGPALPGTSGAPADWESQLNVLKDQVRQLQSDKAVLEAKLKEAFAAQPAALDPRELTRAEEKIKSLEKENELLKVAVEKEKTAPGSSAENRTLKEVQKSLAETNSELSSQKEMAGRLKLENQSLQQQLATSGADKAAASALRAENELLKKQLADLQSAPKSNSKGGDLAQQLAQAQAQIAALQSDKQVLLLEKSALQNRVVALSQGSTNALSTAPASVASAADDKRIQQLQRERDDLQQKLDAANKALYGRKEKGAAARAQELERRLAALQSRLDAYEAHAVPYSPEELALFQKPGLKPGDVAGGDAGRKSIRELSPAVAKLVVDAKRYYQAGQLDKAETTYLEVLKEDRKNAPVLANLAGIQLDAQHLDAAETNITQALAVAPDSPYAIAVFGRLRFLQGRYDDAVDALSRSAKLDPENAEVQNFLGLALNEKGLRGPAEAALRKAIQLEPGYANAHNNLAVVYITQKPPAVELAKWHYQRALAAGGPHNPALEKLIADKK